MSRHLTVHRIGPGATVQDQGRPGYLANGLSWGGAVDALALYEGAALLGQDPTAAVLEMPGTGGTFEASEDMRVALTGAPMRASIDDTPLVWNASHLLPKGARLMIGAAEIGNYGYLHLGGGLQPDMCLGARSAHLAGGIGGVVQPGTQIPVGSDAARHQVGNCINVTPRFGGGMLRIVPCAQTALFDQAQIARFLSAEFRRDMRGNRMGVRLLCDGKGYHSDAGLSVLSEVIVPGDIQVTGDGTPFVLLSECQTTGGYPRIGAVLPADLPIVAQARPGAVFRFCMLSLAEAVDVERQDRARRLGLASKMRPLIRNPHDIPDLLSFQLISGATTGSDLDG